MLVGPKPTMSSIDQVEDAGSAPLLGSRACCTHAEEVEEMMRVPYEDEGALARARRMLSCRRLLRRTEVAGSLGDLNPLPSSLMVLATISWVCYGLSVSNPYIVASNVPGAIVALLSFVSFMPLMKGNSQLKAVQYTLVGGASAALLLWTKLILGGATSAARSSAVGMFASPLSTMKTVIAEKNAASILAPLTLCQVTNCLMWTVYGFIAAKDVFVWGPNGTGLILGLVQLALKLLYPTK